VPAPPEPITTTWQTATVVAVTDETRRARTLRLRLATPTPHLAGQHYVFRLTAPDGYTASRSYSIASAPGSPELDFTVERLDDGEVSTFLHDVVRPGDELEVRGPLGGWFVWDGTTPALLAGGGSGVVPLMAMLRLARATGRRDLVRLVVSVRSPDDLLYANELPGPESTRRPLQARPGRRGPTAGAADRCRSAAHARSRGSHRLRLWLDRVRRRGDEPAGRPGCPCGRHTGRALRPDRNP